MQRILTVIFLTFLLGSANIVLAAEDGPTPEDVTFVQGLLTRFGYDPGPIDGICGDLTATAIRAFHEARNLPLEPGDVEPQAATIAKNLTTAFAEHVTQPKNAAQVYQEALAGDADAALDVGLMYDRGNSVAADKMLAYTWWSVAETSGNAEATKMKDHLAAAGEVSDHEMSYATALAEQIRASTLHTRGESSRADEKVRPSVTM